MTSKKAVAAHASSARRRQERVLSRMRARATLSKHGRWFPTLLPTKLTPCTRGLDSNLFEEPPELTSEQKDFLIKAAQATVYIEVHFYKVGLVRIFLVLQRIVNNCNFYQYLPEAQ